MEPIQWQPIMDLASSVFVGLVPLVVGSLVALLGLQLMHYIIMSLRDDGYLDISDIESIKRQTFAFFNWLQMIAGRIFRKDIIAASNWLQMIAGRIWRDVQGKDIK